MSDVVAAAWITVGGTVTGMLLTAVCSSFFQMKTTRSILDSEKKHRHEEVRRKELTKCISELLVQADPNNDGAYDQAKISSLVAECRMYLNDSIAEEKALADYLISLKQKVKGEHHSILPGGTLPNKTTLAALQEMIVRKTKLIIND